MSWAERLLTAGRRLVLLDDKVERLESGLAHLTAKADDHELRLVRLETALQLLGGVTLPPITPPALPPR